MSNYIDLVPVGVKRISMDLSIALSILWLQIANNKLRVKIISMAISCQRLLRGLSCLEFD
jgi:hypothetical protein